MKRDTRTICRDNALKLEAYYLNSIAKPFPTHFHEHYVIGLIESGTRRLICNGKEYLTGEGSMLLFNPNDAHGCVQADGGYLSYRGINIPPETMLSLTRKITGKEAVILFSENVIENSEINSRFCSLHQMIMIGSGEPERQEALLHLISLLIEKYGQHTFSPALEYDEEVEKACEFMENHFDERITLDVLCRHCGLSKSTLLRSFTKSRKVTPYRYLQTLRICRAKALLEKGISPAEAALRTGFFDQSHFTNFFNMFTGLSPSAYCRTFNGGKNEK